MKTSTLATETERLKGMAGGTHQPALADFQLDMLMGEVEEADSYFPEVKEKKVGRPKGRVNRSTDEVRKFLALNGFKDPLVALASIYTMDIEDLAAHLGCSKHEAFKLQLHAKGLALPYVHQKTPTQIVLPPDVPRTLIIMNDIAGGSVANGRDDGVMSIHEGESA